MLLQITAGILLFSFSHIIKASYDKYVLEPINKAALFIAKHTHPKSHNHGLIGKYLHYGIFNAGLLVLGMYLPVTQLLFWSIIFGSIFQGDPACPAQKRIIQSPVAAAIAGGVNGLMCCIVQESMILLLSESLGLQWFGVGAAFLINWGVSAEYMCFIENSIGNLLQVPKISDECCVIKNPEPPQKTNCCGH